MSLSITAQGDWPSPGGTPTPTVVISTAVPGIYVFSINRALQLAGDDITVTMRKKIRNVGAGNTAEIALFKRHDDAPVNTGADAENRTVYDSAAVACPYGVEVELDQMAGVTHSFPWSLVRVG